MAEQDGRSSTTRPFAQLGDGLRRARENKGVSLRQLARDLYTTHSNLHDYEVGFRLAPEQIVEGYEKKLALDAGSLLRVREEVTSSRAAARGQPSPDPVVAPAPARDLSPKPDVQPDPDEAPGREAARRRWLLALVALAALAVLGVVLGLRPGSSEDSGRLNLRAVGDRLTLGDYNGDGKADVAMAYDAGDGTLRIDVWYSTGSAFGHRSRSKPLRVGAVAGRIGSGDFNGDRKDEIVMAAQNPDGTASLEVWSAGSTDFHRWYQSGPFSLPAVGDRLAVGDYDGDGKADVAMVADGGDGTMTMHVWSSTGSEFREAAPRPSEPFALSAVAGRMAAGDVDGDGKDDVVMAQQNADGTFTFHVWNAAGTHAGNWYVSGAFNLSLVDNRLVLGDYTGDGKADAAMAYDMGNATMRIYRWVSTGSAFTGLTRYDSRSFMVDNAASRMASGDLNGDGNDEIVFAYQEADGTFSYYVWSVTAGPVSKWYTSADD